MSDPPPADEQLAAVAEVMAEYRSDHPLAQIDAFRRTDIPDTIRVRVIDPDFCGMPANERADRVLPLLRGLPEPIADQITTVLAFSPDEAAERAVETAIVRDVYPWERPNGAKKIDRRELAGTRVYGIAVRPYGTNLEPIDAYQGFLKFTRPPAVIDIDGAEVLLGDHVTAEGGRLSVDSGELLRDERFHPRWFPTADAAIEAAFAEAERRLARDVARRQPAPSAVESAEPESAAA